MKKPKHRWTEDDDILTYYIYRVPNDDEISLQRIAQHIGFDRTGSVDMRVRNFASLDGIGKLSNAAKLSKQVHAKYRNIDIKTHRQKCLAIFKAGNSNRGE